ncbi:MAG TPA: class D sortase [Thermoanaerobaculia bacterium]|nr:class D sortase [Thermoanaerobaculia bacterium]
MSDVSKSLRLVEIMLWVLGLSLIGAAFGETRERWNYQAQQERALFQGGPAASVDKEQPTEQPIAPEILAALGLNETVEAPAPANEAVDRAAAAAGPRRGEPRPRTVGAAPSALGRIEIPRIGVAAIVKDGADEETLARAVGRVPGSARPGQVGNMVLAGHRDTFFRPLRDIKVNDRIRMVVPPNTYEYKVDSVMVVSPEDTNVLRSKGKEEITLVTCFPFRFIGPSPDRFVVSATRVN